MTDYKRLKDNITTLHIHAVTHKPVTHITNGKTTETHLVYEIIKDVNSILKKIDNKTLVEFPCKVGTEIFGLFDNDDEQKKEIYEGKVLCYSLDENNLLWARMRYKNGLTYWHTIDDFGKTVFLTKEEAERELEKRNGNGTTQKL